MDLNAPNMTPAEWELMRIIWTKEQATSNEIITLVQGTKAWSASTVKTLLRRLVAKNYLQTENIGRRFIYKPLIAEVDALDTLSNAVFTNICAMRQGSVIINLLETIPLSQSDIATMQTILAAKATTAPVSVACNCVSPAKCSVC